MIGYVTLGTNDFERAAKFYDGLFAVLDVKRAWATESFIAWTSSLQVPALAICKPHDKNEATVGNGVMVALAMKSREQVDTMYNKAIELGATCEGPLGERSKQFYAGYFRDLDGNKLCAFYMGE